MEPMDKTDYLLATTLVAVALAISTEGSLGFLGASALIAYFLGYVKLRS
jgi:hypothetical protein